MPLTPAEKQRKYREKLKNENPEKYQQMKKKTAECALRYYRRKTGQYTDSEKEERRQKWRDERKKKKQAELDKSQEYLNNANKNIQKSQKLIESKIRMENNNLKKEMIILRKEMEALKKRFYRQSKKLDRLNIAFQKAKATIDEINKQKNEEMVDNVTPLKKTENFINKNLTNMDSPQKEIVKRKILEYNVLAESLKKEYKQCVGAEKVTLKKIVTNDIVKKYKLKTTLKSTLGLITNIKRNRDRKIKKYKILNEIKDFYDRDDVSRATSGRKEYKTKNKIKMQRRYLLAPIKIIYEKYVSEGGKVSLSTFKKYRPFYVLTPKITERDTCACMKHSNMVFMVKKLKQIGILDSEHLKDITSKMVCDVTSKTCMYGLCESCKSNNINANHVQLNLDDRIVWPTWMLKNYEYGKEGNKKTTKKMVKTESEGSIQDLINLINSDMKRFLIHSYNISHQYNSYKFCIANLKDNEVVIHIDFSENYVCKLHTEVQAMHFGSSKVQITLHTGVLYLKGQSKPISFCSICPENIHNPEAIWAHLTPIFQYLKTHNSKIDTIHFFSDGPTSQYRNKKNFYFLSQIQSYGFRHATWSFFEAAHGKGAADGIGGAVKRSLDSKVAHGEDIPDAKTAFKVLSRMNTAIKMFYIPPENVTSLLKETVENLLPVPNTLKVHQVIFNDQFSVNYRELSCFCRNLDGKCDCHSVKTHKFAIRKPRLQKFTKSKKLEKINKRRVRSLSSSTTESEELDIQYAEDSDITHFSETDYQEYLDEDIAERQHETIDRGSTKSRSEVEELEKTSVKERSEETLNEKQNIISNKILQQKSAAEKGVTILSEIRNTPWNKGYFDLTQFSGLQFQKMELNYDLFAAKKSLHNSKSEENIDPYMNPVPSTSGTGHIKIKQPKKCDKILSRKELDLDDEKKIRTIKSNLIQKKNYDPDLINEEYRNIEKNENFAESCNPDIVIESGNEKVEDSDNNIRSNLDLDDIKINQSVLVRYYMRKNWKYYVGHIEKIDTKDEEKRFTVNFLKTVNKPKLKFVVSKKIDRDIVSSISVVKPIQLKTDKMGEYLLVDDSDMIYFET